MMHGHACGRGSEGDRQRRWGRWWWWWWWWVGGEKLGKFTQQKLGLERREKEHERRGGRWDGEEEKGGGVRRD